MEFLKAYRNQYINQDCCQHYSGYTEYKLLIRHHNFLKLIYIETRYCENTFVNFKIDIIHFSFEVENELNISILWVIKKFTFKIFCQLTRDTSIIKVF